MQGTACLRCRSFNPRTPRGVRPGIQHFSAASRDVSIHAPLAGCDLLPLPKNSRLRVSIHAPLAGCDGMPRDCSGDPHRFNPRTPRGVRPRVVRDYRSAWSFQSTHPSRGATRYDRYGQARRRVSIHAPLAGCDLFTPMCSLQHASFQSTHPSRGATETDYIDAEFVEFQSTHPSRGAT